MTRRSRRWRALALMLLAAFFAPIETCAEPPADSPATTAATATNLRDRFVVVIVPEAPLKVGTETVDKARWGDIYRVVRQDKDWFWIRPANRFLSHQRRGWLAASATAPLETAPSLYARALEANPRNHAAYAARAAYWLPYLDARVDPEKSLADINAALRLSPTNAQYLVDRAHIYNRLKRYEDAFADCEAALAIDPKLGSAFCARGEIYRLTKRYSEALIDFDKAAQVGCCSPGLPNSRGRALLAESRFDAAIESFSQAIRLDATQSHIYHLRAQAWYGKDDVDKGLQDISQAIRLEPKDPAYLLTRSWAHQYLGNAKAGMRDAAAVLDLDENNAAALSRFVWCPSSLLPDTVLSRLDAMIEKSPDEPQLYSYRGCLRAMSSNYAGAIADFEKSTALSPERAEGPLSWLDTLYALVGDHAKASESWKRTAAEARSPDSRFPNRDLFEPVVEVDYRERDPVLKPEDILAEFDVPIEANHILVPVRIAGKVLRFALDTGASTSIFDKRYRSLLGQSLGRQSITTPTGQGSLTMYEPAVIQFAGTNIRNPTHMGC